MNKKQKTNGGRKTQSPTFQPKYEEDSDSITERLARVESTIERWQGALGSSKWFGGILATILLGTMGWAINAEISMSRDIAILKSQSPLALSKKAESIIQKSTSPGQLAEANSLIVRASKSSAGIEPTTLKHISSSLANQEQSSLGSPEYWRTVSTVVNIKSNYTGRPTPNNDCLSGHLAVDLGPYPIDQWGDVYPETSQTQKASIAEFRLQNCSLQIDNVSQFWNSSYGKFLKSRKAANPNLKTFILVLVNVQVRYSGGPLLPFTKIICVNCSYSIDLPAPPKLNGQTFVKQLLVADLQKPQLTLSLHGGD